MTCAEARPLLSRSLDRALTRRETLGLEAHLHGCAECRAVRRRLEADHRLLAQQWPAFGAPAGFTERVTAALPACPREQHRGTRRLAPALAAAVALLTAVTLAVPPVRAGVGAALRHVVLRESEPPSAPRTIGPFHARSLPEAQRLVPWRIRMPRDLPEGYRLVGVVAEEIHSFADGRSVLLYYQRGDGPDAPMLRVVELRAAGTSGEPVEPGAVSTVRAGDRDARLIDGEWVERDGRQVWQRGTLLRVIVEDGDLVIQLEADPRDGWDAATLAKVAASVR